MRSILRVGVKHARVGPKNELDSRKTPPTRNPNSAARPAGPLPPREAAKLMTKLARAAQHAHERGVLHRDLKPGNVLFDPAGEPMLTDFDLAKLADVASGLTLSIAHLGTPQYMAPEQFEGREAQREERE